MASLTALLRFWQPREIWRFPDAVGEDTNLTTSNVPIRKFSKREIARAWTPWIILSLCVFLWGVPQFRTFLDGGKPSVTSASLRETDVESWWERPNLLKDISERRWVVPFLHEQVRPDATIIGGDGRPKAAEFRFNWLSATRTGIMFAAILSAWWIGISPYRFGRLFLHTLHRLRSSLFTIAAMLAIAFTTQYSGTDVTLGLTFTRTGVLYPFFAAMLGWLGVALMGSDTSSNALFGNLQRVTAERLGLSPVLICAADSTGGVMGKMIDAQSIVVASVATGQRGHEGQLLRFVFWHSVALASLVGLVTLVQAYLLPAIIPNS
jgi:lactate permease